MPFTTWEIRRGDEAQDKDHLAASASRLCDVAPEWLSPPWSAFSQAEENVIWGEELYFPRLIRVFREGAGELGAGPAFSADGRKERPGHGATFSWVRSRSRRAPASSGCFRWPRRGLAVTPIDQTYPQGLVRLRVGALLPARGPFALSCLAPPEPSGGLDLRRKLKFKNLFN